MVEYEEKYTVIKRDDISVKLSHFEQAELRKIIHKINIGREDPNKYYICNQDEPYAHRVIGEILDGEQRKEDAQCLCDNCKNQDCEGWEGKITPSHFTVRSCKGYSN